MKVTPAKVKLKRLASAKLTVSPRARDCRSRGRAPGLNRTHPEITARRSSRTLSVPRSARVQMLLSQRFTGSMPRVTPSFAATPATRVRTSTQRSLDAFDVGA
jgi:hypothetical protein